jgi:uncharacterized membrane protein
MNKTRLEAFSDGVLAILVTIMVLELKVPSGTSWTELHPVLETLGSYLLSFTYLAIYWGNHHHLLHTVGKVNAKIMWANMHLLFWLSLVPFATSWMGGNSFDSISVAVYGALLVLCGLSFGILTLVIEQNRIEHTKLSEAFKKTRAKERLSTFFYVSSIPLAFVQPVISCAIFVIVAIMWIVPSKEIEEALGES